MSNVLEDTDVCAKMYRCGMDVSLLTVLSSIYGIIMDRAINAFVHRKNVFSGINDTGKHDLRAQMKLLGKLSTNNTSNIGMLLSASNNVPFIFQNNVHTLSLIMIN